MGRLSSFREVRAGLPLKAYPAVRTRGVPHADASPSHALPARAIGYGLELTPSERRLFTIRAIFPVRIGDFGRRLRATVVELSRASPLLSRGVSAPAGPRRRGVAFGGAADRRGEWVHRLEVYQDQAAQELKALIEAKLAGQPVASLETERAILPLLEALQQSVAAQNGQPS